MSVLDPQTQAWINSLKLNKSFKNTSDFENGYNFGVIFQKLQISRGKKFKNSSDLGCIFNNYKNVKDLLMENFGYDFPANNIIYRTEDLLKVLRDQTTKYIEKKKAATLKAATSINAPNAGSLLQPQEQKNFKTRQKEINTMLSNTKFNQTAKLPKKIQDIEKKLDKYRQEKTRHQLVALEQRKQEIDYHRRVIQQNRDYEINKIRRMHDSTREHEKKVYDVWAKTEMVKKNRITVDKELQRFQNEKKFKLSQTLRKQQVDFIDKGMEMFQLNCIRQGIQLDHDPDKPMKPEGDFNRVVILERIKDNINKHQTDKKQRIKRQNKKRIDADEAKAKSEEVWREINKLEDYQSKFMEHAKMCEKTHATEQRLKAEKQIRKGNFKERQFIDLPSIGDEESRNEEYRKRRLQYLFKQVQQVQKKWNYDHSMAEEVVQALLQTVIVSEDLYLKNQGFTYTEWKDIEDVFMNFQGNTAKKKKGKGKNSQYFIDFSTFDSILKQYLAGKGTWKNFNSEETAIETTNQDFVNFVSSLISRAYPDQPLPEHSDLPLYMPLKVSINGSRLAGKTSVSAKISQKYGIPIIDPVELLTQSIDLAKPPVQQDPKKAGKKDPKKTEQPTPQKIALKQFGEKLLQQEITSIQSVKIQHYIEVIKLRLKQLFSVKSQEQILAQYSQCKQKEIERHEQALKQFQEAKNKPKKDSKKGAVANDAPEEPPKINQTFYATGFIIDGFPFNLQNLQAAQKELNAYISDEERINAQGQQVKQKLSIVLPIPEKVKDTRLKSGTFDILAELTSSKESLMKRKDGRKIDPATKIVYHAQFNPIPGDVKGFADRLTDLPSVSEPEIDKSLQTCEQQFQKLWKFYQSFGVQNGKIQAYQKIGHNDLNTTQTIESVVQMIQKMLLAKYSEIEQKINSRQLEKRQKMEEQQRMAKIKEEELANLGQQKKQQEIHSQNNQQKVQETPENQEGQKDFDENQQKQGQKKAEQEVEAEIKANIVSDKNFEQKSQVEIPPTLAVSLQKIISYEISSFDCKEVLMKYILNVETYEDSIKQCLYNLDQQRQNFTKQLLNTQKNFINIINRPDDKAGKILGFQENYNKLLNEQGNIVRDAEASKHLIHRLDELYNSLWNAIGGKKDEAIEHRIRFMQSDWLNEQALRIVDISRRLLQAELDYICEAIFFILSLLCKYQGKSSDYMTEYLSLGIAPELQPINSISYEELTKSDRLEYYLDQVDRCLSNLPQWIEQKHKKMKITPTKSCNELFKKFVEFSLWDISRKKQIIRNKIIERILEERSYYHILINKMDEWIIQGIKSQNDFVYQIYKTIKKSIEEAKKSNVKELHVKQITEQFNPIREITLNPIPLRVFTSAKNLPIFSYMVFLEETKTLITYNGGIKNRISFDTFKKYLEKRKKSKLLDPEILEIDYDTVQQYLVKDGLINYRELSIAVLFHNVKVFDDESLMKYRRRLLKVEEEKNNHSLQEINAQNIGENEENKNKKHGQENQASDDPNTKLQENQEAEVEKE